MHLKAQVHENDLHTVISTDGSPQNIPADEGKKFWISTITVCNDSDGDFTIKNSVDDSVIFYTKLKASTPIFIDLHKEVFGKLSSALDLLLDSNSGSFTVTMVLL